MKVGSFFLAEIKRTISSLSPRGTVSASISVTNPYLYSWLTRSSVVYVAVFMVSTFPFLRLVCPIPRYSSFCFFSDLVFSGESIHVGHTTHMFLVHRTIRKVPPIVEFVHPYWTVLETLLRGRGFDRVNSVRIHSSNSK